MHDRKNVRSSMLWAVILGILCILSVQSVSAIESVDINKTADIVVFDDGREKPLDTYARKKLIQFSGRKTIKGMSANEWLLKLMFNPSEIDTIEVFRITNPEVLDAVGIQGPPKRRYRYVELYPVIDKIESIAINASKKELADLLPFERDVLQLWLTMQEYNAIGAAFSASDPFDEFSVHDSSLAESLQLEIHTAYTYGDIVKHSSMLSKYMQGINSEKLDSLSGADAEVVRIVRSMYGICTQMENRPPFLIYSEKDSSGTHWYSLWSFLCNNGAGAFGDERYSGFVALRNAYVHNDRNAFLDAAKRLSSQKFHGSPNPGIEVVYNRVNLQFIAKILLVISAILVMYSMFFTSGACRKLSFLLVIFAAVLQSTTLFMRILIQQRPPLASLYETFIFVAWVIVVLGLIFEIVKRNSNGTLIASLGGFLFLYISGRYVVNGDTFGIIAAVLNSGFWLTTHIVTISIGYAGCLIAGIFGHMYLILRVRNTDKKMLDTTDAAVYLFLLIGLGFTVTGTVLGGMWADQAWGRFWGWDPKENGALLIIIWLTLIVHSRKSRLIGPDLTSAGAVAGVIMVMLAWVGVNLLGVGLHSYGFTYSGLGMLIGVSLFEILFIGITLSLAAIRRNGAGSLAS
ncbi:MAG: cytochrome c biogenesis protein [Fibrobacterota bacterium]|nr:cytochrome c biogenesis protein CcsA [Chitinispirillaceae bacterium]